MKFWDLVAQVHVDIAGKCTLIQLETFDDVAETQRLYDNINSFKKYIFYTEDGL